MLRKRINNARKFCSGKFFIYFYFIRRVVLFCGVGRLYSITIQRNTNKGHTMETITFITFGFAIALLLPIAYAQDNCRTWVWVSLGVVFVAVSGFGISTLV